MLVIKTLLPELKKLVTALSEDLLARSTAKNDPYSAKVDTGLREAYAQIEQGGRTADPFEVWREDYLDQVAVAWVLACVFVRFMEDNHLIDECWLAGEGERRKLAEDSQLTRRTIAAILQGMSDPTFDQYKVNPEDFLAKAARLINEQKATVIVEHLTYDMVDDRYDSDIFTREKPKEDFSKAIPVTRHVYEYVFTDSKNEREFVRELDTSVEVVVYAKLPRSFFIPTPVGNYNPDWAIAFEEGKVKHIYFIAETKGSMSSMDLRLIEDTKIECARKFFRKITSDQVKYDVVNNYGKLMELVK